MNNYIQFCKEFWNIRDFKTEIYDWEFKCPFPSDMKFNLGHPMNSHKGNSVGDIIPYTLLPELIKKRFPKSYVTVPKHFYSIFKYNRFVDDFDGDTVKWGSLGTWGNTIQRTCNVWGIKTFNFSPKLYYPKKNNNDRKVICFSTNSNAGGYIQNISVVENIVEELKKQFTCVQIGLSSDPIIRNVDFYILNLELNKLIYELSKMDIYIGIHNSLYHISKALDLKVIGIISREVDPRLVVLPLLTQNNRREIEMLSNEEQKRALEWEKKIINSNINIDGLHHVGWLYPDSCHLVDNDIIETDLCPKLSVDNIIRALKNEIYPFGNPIFWDFENYHELWY